MRDIIVQFLLPEISLHDNESRHPELTQATKIALQEREALVHSIMKIDLHPDSTSIDEELDSHDGEDATLIDFSFKVDDTLWERLNSEPDLPYEMALASLENENLYIARDWKQGTVSYLGFEQIRHN